MTQAQISANNNPANGLQVFCTTDRKMYIFVELFVNATGDPELTYLWSPGGAVTGG